MTNASHTILLQRKDMEWIAIGVFAGGDSLVAAVTELTSIGVSLPDLCIAGASASMHRIAAAPEVQDLHPLRALLRSAVETKLPGCDDTILAAPTCVGSATSFLSAEMVERLRVHIVGGCILLAASARSAADAAEVGRILLRHSSHYVHMLQYPPPTAERTLP